MGSRNTLWREIKIHQLVDFTFLEDTADTFLALKFPNSPENIEIDIVWITSNSLLTSMLDLRRIDRSVKKSSIVGAALEAILADYAAKQEKSLLYPNHYR